jgi:hypothetical protein
VSATSDPLQPARGTSAKTIAALVVILAFIAGLLIGIVGDRIYLFRNRDRVGMRAMRSITEHIVARLDRDLQLTPQQHDEVMRIFETRRQHIEAINAAVRPQIRREIDEGNAEIEKILTPEQRVKFDKLKMRMLPRRDHMRGFAPGSTPHFQPLNGPGSEPWPQAPPPSSPAASPRP